MQEKEEAERKRKELEAYRLEEKRKEAIRTAKENEEKLALQAKEVGVCCGGERVRGSRGYRR